MHRQARGPTACKVMVPAAGVQQRRERGGLGGSFCGGRRLTTDPGAIPRRLCSLQAEPYPECRLHRLDLLTAEIPTIRWVLLADDRLIRRHHRRNCRRTVPHHRLLRLAAPLTAARAVLALLSSTVCRLWGFQIHMDHHLPRRLALDIRRRSLVVLAAASARLLRRPRPSRNVAVARG